MSHLEFDWESPVWGHWIDALSSGFTLVRYDGRLNGLSDTSCQNISFETFISDLECVIEATGFDRFVLLGISQGCAFSAEYAVRHPEKVAGLVLYGGYVRGWRARGDANEIERREAMSVLLRQGWGQDDPMFRQVFTNMFIPGANRAQMDWFNELQRRTLTPENAWRLAHAVADIDVAAAMDRITVPTLVLHARNDRVAPLSEGLDIARRIKGARFVELDSANHILLSEEAAFQGFVAETTAFANSVLQSRPAMAMSHKTRRQATIPVGELRLRDQSGGRARAGSGAGRGRSVAQPGDRARADEWRHHPRRFRDRIDGVLRRAQAARGPRGIRLPDRTGAAPARGRAGRPGDQHLHRARYGQCGGQRRTRAGPGRGAWRTGFGGSSDQPGAAPRSRDRHGTDALIRRRLCHHA
ncbi:alpha/beta fold hydrolase [Nordella sp. HKS 07]|nr:alpha/beta fold hydrolase [Nordella sp. HKS 07]